MTKQEFESMANRKVTTEQYNAIETLYLCSTLNKQDFVKRIRLLLKSIPEPNKEKCIKRMCVRDMKGNSTTPNGCYYHIEYVELVDIHTYTGEYIIKALDRDDYEKLAKEGKDLNLSTDFDFDYTQCLDTNYNRVVCMSHNGQHGADIK